MVFSARIKIIFHSVGAEVTTTAVPVQDVGMAIAAMVKMGNEKGDKPGMITLFQLISIVSDAQFVMIRNNFGIDN